MVDVGESEYLLLLPLPAEALFVPLLLVLVVVGGVGENEVVVLELARQLDDDWAGRRVALKAAAGDEHLLLEEALRESTFALHHDHPIPGIVHPHTGELLQLETG